MIPRILGSRVATMFTFATLSALLLSACQQEAPAPTPPAETPAVAPAQPVVQAPALKELDAQARQVKLVTGRLCNIETVDDVKPTADATVPKDVSKLAVAGWIGDEATGKRAENARLLIQTLDRSRAWEQPVGDVIVRKDVAKATSIPTFEDGGFKTSIDLTELPVGEYRVLLVYTNGDQSFVCDNGRRVMR